LPKVRLLVCLPSRWKEFPGNLRAALQPAGTPLPTERNQGGMAAQWLGASAVTHLVGLTVLLWLCPRLPLVMPVVLDESPRPHTAIYYQAPSLPEIEDPSPVAASRALEGQEVFHPMQIIRISRGSVIRTKVVDAPDPALPRIPRATANLLSIPAFPLPSLPQLQAPPAPIEVENVQSKIARPASAQAPQPATVSRLRNTAGQLPNLSAIPVSPVAAERPPSPALVELEKAQSRIARPASAQAPQPATVSRLRNSAGRLPNLSAIPNAPVAGEQPPAASNATRAPSVPASELPSVIISAEPSDVVAVPADGAPGSLAMSPRGHVLPGTGGGSGNTATANATGAAAGKSAITMSPNNSAPSGAAAANLSPGVTVHGGVVSLDSFGPKAASGQPGVVALESFGPRVPALRSRAGSPDNPADPPRKPSPIIVVATSRSGGGLNSYGTFKGQAVYTIYFQTAAGTAVFQFAEHAPSAAYRGDLTPPDPLSANTPPAHEGTGVVISCLLDAGGHVQNVRVVEGASPYSQAVAEAVRTWRFHPALVSGQPVAVDALIGLGVGVR
jgi:TonB family protein